MEDLLTVSGIASSATSLPAQTTWHVVPVNSKLAFVATHLNIADVAGLFKTFTASVTASKADFSDAVFELSADVASINTEAEMRDNHLKSPDFFDVEKYPKMAFRSTDIKALGNNKYELTGNLTLRGIAKPVTLKLWYRGTTENPMDKATSLAGFQITGSISRSDFNIGANFPPPMVSDTIIIKADGEFINQ